MSTTTTATTTTTTTTRIIIEDFAKNIILYEYKIANDLAEKRRRKKNGR